MTSPEPEASTGTEAVDPLTPEQLRAERRRMGIAFAYLVAITSAFLFAREGLASITDLDRGTTVVTLPLVLVMGLALWSLVRALGLPWAFYGVTRERWRASLRDGLLLSIPLLALATVAKVLLVWLSPEHADLPIIDPFDTRGRGFVPEGMVARFFVLNLAYVFIIVPIQELIARGLLQGLLERFIPPPHHRGWAIVLSNLLFAAFHAYISLSVAVATLALGLMLGWLYARTRNLLGVLVAHAIIGVWSLTIVRLQPILG